MDEPLKPGVRVQHSVFGMGTVRAISGSGPDARITVDFGGGVGQKKLLAGMANLKRVDEAVASTPSAPERTYWYETYDTHIVVRPGRRPFIDKTSELLYESLAKPQFWAAVRERLREKGSVPKALDDLNGRLYACIWRDAPEQIRVIIVVRHDEMLKPEEAILAQSAFEQLGGWHLADYISSLPFHDFKTTRPLEEKWLVNIGEVDPGPLPDRDPKRRPVREQPKGVIRNRPKGRDEY